MTQLPTDSVPPGSTEDQTESSAVRSCHHSVHTRFRLRHGLWNLTSDALAEHISVASVQDTFVTRQED